MFNSPYQTTPCQNHDRIVADIRKALLAGFINDELEPAKTTKGVSAEKLLEIRPYVKSIPAFSHPFVLERDDGKVVVLDRRAFKSVNRAGDERITNSTEYAFAMTRGLMTLGWINGDQSVQAGLGEIAMRTYTRLLAEGITRRLGLNPGEQLTLNILAGYFHACQYVDEASVDEQVKIKMAARIARAVSTQLAVVLPVIEHLEPIANIHQFCEAARAVIPSPRLHALNPGLVYAMVTGCWFGAYAREVVGVAIEYPPTFLAMVLASLADRTYHNAYFSKLVESSNRGHAGKEFLINMTGYLESMTHV